MNEKKQRNTVKENSFGKKKQIVWSLRTFSSMACAMVIGYVTYYGTNVLEIPALTVGALIMISKIFDAFTDLLGGFLVDHTKTKLGKARPYELAMIGLWVCTVIMYACPDFGMRGKCIWLLIWYTLLNDVFFTLLNASEPVYMMRAIPSRENMEKTASLNGIFTIMGAMVVSIVYPILMETLGKSKGGWTVMALIFAVPMMLIGLLRFLFIPEVKEVATEKKEKIAFKEIIASLKSNRYIYLYLILTLLVNMLSNMSSSMTYYFNYIVGNKALMSVASLPTMITPFLLLIFPKLLKKHSIIKISCVCSIIGVIGSIIKQFAGANIMMILIGTLVSGIGTLPLSAFMVILLTDTVDYNEYKTGTRVEGIYASLGSFGQKIGIALASALTGVLLEMAGFISSETAVQPESALTMIRAMFGIVPGIFMVIIFVVLLFFDIEKKMPEVHAALNEKNKLEKNCE